MMKRVLFGLCAVIAVVCARNPLAQEREDRTLLSHEQMRAIVNEASGERAMHHVMELVPYPRIRPVSEYQGHFRESDVMAGFAKEYGFSSVEIESFPSAQRSWAPTMGELWLMTPTEQKKLYDIHDVAVSVAANSQNGDVTGELVDVGLGTRAADYVGKDLKREDRDRIRRRWTNLRAGIGARCSRRGRLQHPLSRSRRRRHPLVQHFS